ncbi:MAG TPA: amidohydrolase family protein [Candidatus Binatia bacterium]|nr:amidohydrolase family protein [Candidatus Binatia bacterium]
MTAALCAPAAWGATVDCGHLLDVKAGRWRENVRLTVESGHFAAVAPAADGGADVDLRALWCLPGLIDMHVHLTDQTKDQAHSFRDTVQRNLWDQAYESTGFAERTLLAGFTTVRDLGAEGALNVSLKHAIEQGWVRGPRMLTAGIAIGSTGGHADPTDGYKHEFAKAGGPADGVIDSVDDARKAVRARYKEGADLIKVMVTGGVLDLSASGDNAQLTEEEIRAIVATAKDYGFRVAVHAHGAEGMKRAIRAGVDSVEHGTYMDDEAMRLFRQKGTWYVPTLSAGRFCVEKAKLPDYFPAIIRPKALAIGPLMAGTFARAWKAGVKVAFGTDTGVSPHGENAKEFAYLAEAGMPAIEAIRAATLNAAELLRAGEKLGSVEPGYAADLIAVDGDALADVTRLQHVAFVMKAGSVVKTP